MPVRPSVLMTQGRGLSQNGETEGDVGASPDASMEADEGRECEADEGRNGDADEKEEEEESEDECKGGRKSVGRKSPKEPTRAEREIGA